MHFDSFHLHKWCLRLHKPHGEYQSPLFSLLIDEPWIAVDRNNRGRPLESAAKHLNRRVHSLVGFLPVGPSRSSSAVVSLDYEGVFLLALAVNGAVSSQDALSRGAIQHHRFKRHVLAVDLKSTDLPWRKEKENNELMQQNCPKAPTCGHQALQALHQRETDVLHCLKQTECCHHFRTRQDWR